MSVAQPSFRPQRRCDGNGMLFNPVVMPAHLAAYGLVQPIDL
jgi:hypothetical protein